MQTDQIASSDEKLPFDPRTLMIGLFRRWPIPIVSFIIACVLGVFAGLKFGTRTYTASTALLYKPIGEGENGLISHIPTQLSLVKLRTNIAEVRQRLELATTLEDLGSACKVENPRGTRLIIISAQWESGEVAAAIANTLRDVFISGQQSMSRAVSGREVRALDERVEVARRQWESAETELRKFLAKNKIVNPDQDSERYFNELAQLDRMYERALVQQDIVENGEGDMSLVSSQIAPAEEAGAVALPGITESGSHIQRLVQSIEKERTRQVDIASFERAKKEYENAQILRSKGMISESVYEVARIEYEGHKARLTDSKEIKQKKKELTDALGERIGKLKAAREALKSRVDALPTIQRQFVILSREVAFRDAVKRELEEKLVKTRQIYESNTSEFNIISEATPPVIPNSSSRRLIAAGIAAGGGIAAFVLVLLLELLNTTIKSGAEFSLKLSMPLLGVLSRISSDAILFPNQVEPELIERFRMIAQNIRNAVPQKGARILFLSATESEGVTSIISNLALCFGRQDERVLLLDGQIREGEHEHEIRDLIPEGIGALKGLGEYLSYQIDCIGDVVWPTILPGVECIPRVEDAVIPDLIGSNRMADLLEEASARFGLVLIDAPPLLSYVDTFLLARWADGIVFVVKSCGNRAGVLKEAVKRIEVLDVPIVGAILNRVEPVYMENV